MNAIGFNPIEWKCETAGCFNELMRPKIEMFAECFPRNVAMMDIDGTVELNGHFLFLEFKTSGNLKAGQRYYLTRLTALSAKIEAMVIACNSAIMDIHGVAHIQRGTLHPWDACDLDGLKALIKDWASRVDGC
jgi:hypothetical protein